MVFLIITIIALIISIVDLILDQQCVELLVGKKKDFDLIGCFYKFTFPLFLIFGLLTLFFNGYSDRYRTLSNRQEAASEQYLLSDKTQEDWTWICNEMNSINEEMKELEENRKQRKLWDWTAFFSSYDYESCKAEITENTISFNAERHLIPLQYKGDDTE